MFKFKRKTDYLWDAIEEERAARSGEHLGVRNEIIDLNEMISELERRMDSAEEKQELQGADASDLKSDLNYYVKTRLEKTSDTVIKLSVKIDAIERMQKTQNVILVIIGGIVGGAIPLLVNLVLNVF